jgi:hypothetical protein
MVATGLQPTSVPGVTVARQIRAGAGTSAQEWPTEKGRSSLAAP